MIPLALARLFQRRRRAYRTLFESSDPTIAEAARLVLVDLERDALMDRDAFPAGSATINEEMAYLAGKRAVVLRIHKHLGTPPRIAEVVARIESDRQDEREAAQARGSA